MIDNKTELSGMFSFFVSEQGHLALSTTAKGIYVVAALFIQNSGADQCVLTTAVV